jgi:hypothetical protein
MVETFIVLRCSYRENLSRRLCSHTGLCKGILWFPLLGLPSHSLKPRIHTSRYFLADFLKSDFFPLTCFDKGYITELVAVFHHGICMARRFRHHHSRHLYTHPFNFAIPSSCSSVSSPVCGCDVQYGLGWLVDGLGVRVQ